MDGSLCLFPAQRAARRAVLDFPGRASHWSCCSLVGWRRYYKGEGASRPRVAKNSRGQVVMSLFNRGIDFAFAMLRLRVAQPEGEGSYVFAITFYLIAEIVTRFGLGTLADARLWPLRRAGRRKYLTNVVLLRSLLWMISLPVMALALLVFQRIAHSVDGAEDPGDRPVRRSAFFANIADALSSVFHGRLRNGVPRQPTPGTVAKVALSGLVLLPPLKPWILGWHVAVADERVAGDLALDLLERRCWGRRKRR